MMANAPIKDRIADTFEGPKKTYVFPVGIGGAVFPNTVGTTTETASLLGQCANGVILLQLILNRKNDPQVTGNVTFSKPRGLVPCCCTPLEEESHRDTCHNGFHILVYTHKTHWSTESLDILLLASRDCS